MHICVIGDGAAGLMAANFFASRDYVKKLTHIGSSKIPSIGVGESTTLLFEELHRAFDPDFDSFIRESDACVKTGVMYSNWSKNEFLHYFKVPNTYERFGISFLEYCNTLGNKDPDMFIHDLIAHKLYHDVKQNRIPTRKKNSFYGAAWHFDAGKYISYLKKILKTRWNNVTVLDDVVVDCKFKDDGVIDSILLESNHTVEADYYIIATGKSKKTADIFKIEYEDLSNVLLTDKALFFPKPYINKREEMHPYTIAKTMKNGWRWITPTWSRIGTGYVFSSNHITVEEVIEEFREDIGDNTITPNVVDFHPKYSKRSFNKNYVTMGMCNGFLEPLDAPGLSISCSLSIILDTMFDGGRYYHSIVDKTYDYNLDNLNDFAQHFYKGWAAFILTQYKTCYRSDTQFWIDHKNVKFDYLEDVLIDLNSDINYSRGIVPAMDHFDCNDNISDMLDAFKINLITMLQNTIASKDVQWQTKTTAMPYQYDDPWYNSVDHYEFLQNIRNFNGDLTWH
jgi:tryptophan halogenase